LCRSCFGRFLSAATVNSVWHLCSKIFEFMDIIPHIMCGLSMEILWKFHGQSRSGVNCGVRLQSRRVPHSAKGGCVRLRLTDVFRCRDKLKSFKSVLPRIYLHCVCQTWLGTQCISSLEDSFVEFSMRRFVYMHVCCAPKKKCWKTCFYFFLSCSHSN
jgi:hypothetical protein